MQEKEKPGEFLQSGRGMGMISEGRRGIYQRCVLTFVHSENGN